jgi:hypothetical protein
MVTVAPEGTVRTGVLEALGRWPQVMVSGVEGR